MKMSKIYTLFVILLLAAISMSNRSGRASAANWGNTGAPGDETLSNGQSRTCVTCHNNSAAIQVTLGIEIEDEDGNSIVNDGYVPGTTYDVKVILNTERGTPQGYGFQMLALNGDDGVDATEVSTWSDLGSNVKSAVASRTNRTYVEHDGLSTSNEFTMKWTAPNDLDGPVTFYASGNGVNNNRSSSGDGAAINKVTIFKGLASSSKDVLVNSLSAFPNPVSNELFINVPVAGQFDWRVFNLSGKLLDLGVIQSPGNDTQVSIDVSTLSSGTYMLTLTNREQIFTQKLVVQ